MANPVASNQSVTAHENVARVIVLVATDADNDPLTYSIVASPSHGTLNDDDIPVVIFTPTPEYNGGDSFTFKANDGVNDSNTATVTLTITSQLADDFVKHLNAGYMPPGAADEVCSDDADALLLQKIVNGNNNGQERLLTDTIITTLNTLVGGSRTKEQWQNIFRQGYFH